MMLGGSDGLLVPLIRLVGSEREPGVAMEGMGAAQALDWGSKNFLASLAACLIGPKPYLVGIEIRIQETQ